MLSLTKRNRQQLKLIQKNKFYLSLIMEDKYCAINFRTAIIYRLKEAYVTLVLPNEKQLI